MGKLDLMDAFKHIVVDPRGYELLGTTWFMTDEHGNRKKVYYLDMVLPFGCKISPKRFCLFADALRYAMKVKGVSEVDNYMDDYFTCGPAGTNVCAQNMTIMQQTCDATGFAVQPSKVVGPSPILEYIGIIIDSTLMQLRISNERAADILDELNLWSHRRSCTKRQLLSLIGKLTFVSRVVHSGRTFVREMIELSKKVKHLGHRIKLNKGIQDDIKWWLAYLPQWNGKSWMYDEEWTDNAVLDLWTDASDKGFGAYYQGAWIMEPFDDDQIKRSIAWRELYAIVKAAATWGKHLKQRRVLFHCDNLAVVQILQSGTSKDKPIMQLMRCLFYICATHNFECSAKHVAGVNNSCADALSRLDIDKYRNLAPHADEYSTRSAEIWY
jgi:hypothetical protein